MTDKYCNIYQVAEKLVTWHHVNYIVLVQRFDLVLSTAVYDHRDAPSVTSDHVTSSHLSLLHHSPPFGSGRRLRAKLLANYSVFTNYSVLVLRTTVNRRSYPPNMDGRVMKKGKNLSF